MGDRFWDGSCRYDKFIYKLPKTEKKDLCQNEHIAGYTRLHRNIGYSSKSNKLIVMCLKEKAFTQVCETI